MSSGRGASVAGEPASGRAPTRARCETGNPRPGALAAASPGAARLRFAFAPLEIIFTVLSFLTPLPRLCPRPVTFSPSRKMMCKSSFAAGGTSGSAFGDSGSGSGTLALPAAVLTPGDRVGSPAQHPGPRSSAEGGPGARQAYVPLRQGRGALRASGSPASPRVQVHPRRRRPRLWGRVPHCSAPSRGFRVPCCSQDPSLQPSWPRGAASLGCEPESTGGAGSRLAPLLLSGPGPWSGAPQRPT